MGMGQAGTLPYFGLQGLQGFQQPLYAPNFEELQANLPTLLQRMPALAASSLYDMTAAAGGLPIPTTLTTGTRDQQQTVPSVPYSGVTTDTSKLNRVEAQSPVPSTQQNATQSHQQPPYFLQPYNYYYPSVIPGNFPYSVIPMPQVTNAAHAGTPANTQYQKNYSSHHVPYGTAKVYDDLSQQSHDFTKPPYGTTQTQQKGTANTTVTGAGSAGTDIQVPAYGKTHAQQAFDKQGFHTGTPPPFNLQLAAAATQQLAAGSQAGALGAPTTPYGAPFVPMMTHQPHSQMIHHPQLDSASTSTRGSQQTGSHSQAKSVAKTYGGTYWGSN